MSKQQALRLTEQLKSLSRSTAVGGLQPYRQHTAAPLAAGQPAGAAVQQGADDCMTDEQLQEQKEMDAKLEQVGASLSRRCRGLGLQDWGRGGQVITRYRLLCDPGM